MTIGSLEAGTISSIYDTAFNPPGPFAFAGGRLRRFPVIVLTEPTPNPDALKFIPEAVLTAGARRWFASGEGSALAARLFALKGVGRVFIAPDFVTVTRASDGPPWSELRYSAIAEIADHVASGEPAIVEDGGTGEGSAEDEVVADIRRVLADHVRPGVARDGGDVVFERFEPATGIVWLKLEGACGGCPSSRMTLKAGNEQLLRRYVPEVTGVEQVAPEVAPASPPRWANWAKSAGATSPTGARTLFTHAGRELKRRTG
jgi:Fe-S cluster biogenesis protein NfuA